MLKIHLEEVMKKINRLQNSRDSWKKKATDRAEQLREFRKTKARYQHRIDALKKRLEALEKQLYENQ